MNLCKTLWWCWIPKYTGKLIWDYSELRSQQRRSRKCGMSHTLDLQSNIGPSNQHWTYKATLDFQINIGPSNQRWTFKSTLDLQSNCAVSENTVTNESNGKTMSLSLAFFALVWWSHTCYHGLTFFYNVARIEILKKFESKFKFTWRKCDYFGTLSETADPTH